MSRCIRFVLYAVFIAACPTVLFAEKHGAESDLFPFVLSFDAPKNATDISDRLDAPAGKHGFVHVADGHFATEKGRIRFWGTNTCFSANFLDREAADRMADRLARFGINCVRLHHMDSHDIWGGRGAKTQMELDQGQLDKLDYFVAALKKRGIYVNINLHVSRSLDERDGFPKNVNRPMHDKGIDNYYRPFIEANKKYARDLLTHVNPYTGRAYREEPAVAMIEINNENSILCMWGGWGGLDVIGDPFLADLRNAWNDWLEKKYGNEEALRRAWSGRRAPIGDEMLRNAGFSDGYVPQGDGWSWETDERTDAPITNTDGVLRLDVREKGAVAWHPQLIGRGFAVEKDGVYTLTIRAKANRKSEVRLGVRMNHEPWEGLGFDAVVPLTEEWDTFSFAFAPDSDDEDARIALGGLHAGTVYEIDFLSLKPGGEIGLKKDQSLAAKTVPVIWKKDVGNRPVEAVDDFCDFLFDVEARYWDEMHRFLKEDVQVRQPVCGTQLEYGSTHAQAKMDYCDVHAYWNHPDFPGRPWDGNNWYLRNRALVNYLDREIMVNLATKRVEGKPFTVSEYNHPYPNQYAAEGLPILAAFGAFQDWDGIFPFAYSHSPNVEPRMTTGFFDTAGNTHQMAHMIACRNLFESDGLPADPVVAPLTAENERKIVKKDRHLYNLGFSGLGLDRRIALTQRVAVDVSGKIKEMPKISAFSPDETLFTGASDRIHMNVDLTRKNHGFLSAASDDTRLFTGFVNGKTMYPFGESAILFEKTNLGWATVSLTRISRDGETPRRFLLVATGEMRNTDMKLESLGDDRVTVGNRWGKPPVLCEGITATIKFVEPGLAGHIRYWPLDESGNRREERHAVNGGEVELKSDFQTIWYEVEIR